MSWPLLLPTLSVLYAFDAMNVMSIEEGQISHLFHSH